MSKLNRRAAFVAAAVMLGGGAAAHWMKPTVHLADRLGKPDLETLFPTSFGNWEVDSNTPVILPAPDVQARLDRIYNQVLSRTYVDRSTGRRVMLSVAYGGDQSDGTRLHRPEVCYPAQGFQITANRPGVLQLSARSLQVRQLESHLSGRFEPITYWVVVGDEIVTSASQQKLAQLRYGVRGLIPDGMLVRVSTIDRDPEQAFRVQKQYIDDLARSVSPDAAARVFGKPKA
ncbi:exosortase-associated protein EpsI, B-type [Paucibacter sp. B51]|uniref:exosortase-associated protein EpsI, B-type n=1 Tax=Paucibacter sp. B51 TaxID=2993315 RepID=UPI0022EBB45D|nr:exosortase-associated protein EpsI, B-type [Paucibacter sp. B51]